MPIAISDDQQKVQLIFFAKEVAQHYGIPYRKLITLAQIAGVVRINRYYYFLANDLEKIKMMWDKTISK